MKPELIAYKTMPTWTAETLPEPFRKMHNTKVGTWAHLTILEGALTFYELDEEGNILAEHLFTKESEIPFVEPQAWHRVSPASDDLKCYLTFYCTPEDYFAKKYDLTRTHSEVIEATPKFPKGKVLDLGSGELKDYYAGWTLHKYNEDFGQLHKTDENGNRIKMRFVTLLAEK